MSDVKIVMTAHGQGRVFIDGHEIVNLTDVRILVDTGVHRCNRVRLTMNAETIEYTDPDAIVTTVDRHG